MYVLCVCYEHMQYVYIIEGVQLILGRDHMKEKPVT